MFDRSWYNRAGVERVMGFCTEEQYQRFLHQAPAFEQSSPMTASTWSSSGSRFPHRQLTRFAIRQVDPVRQWKLSPMDLASLDKWDSYTAREGGDVPGHRH